MRAWLLALSPVLLMLFFIAYPAKFSAFLRWMSALVW